MEKIQLESFDNIKIVGLLETVENKENIIILCHGISTDKDEKGSYKNFSKKLNKAGYNVFRFDSRGHGETEGKQEEMTMTKMEKDLEIVIDKIIEMGFRNVYLLGASWTGGIACLYAIKYYQKIKKLILWNPLIDYQNNIINPQNDFGEKFFGKQAVKRIKDNGYSCIGTNNFKLGIGVFDEAKILKPAEDIINVNIPILFVHGDCDNVIPIQQTIDCANKCKNAKLVIIENGEHAFLNNEEVWNKATDETIKFIKEK